jgi:hypothetical protein
VAQIFPSIPRDPPTSVVEGPGAALKSRRNDKFFLLLLLEVDRPMQGRARIVERLYIYIYIYANNKFNPKTDLFVSEDHVG